ncbi:MAG: hypothetical protein C0608_02720 [Deltaproteobacteria bacterium]|nr:MAG: hypothetical protein C0608_02720 [Deltaproteobacteria bacterium]
MKIKALLLSMIIAVSFFAAPKASYALDDYWNVSILLGSKEMDESDWEPLESHGEFGLMTDYKGTGWPLSMAIDLYVSASDEKTFYDSSVGYFDVSVTTSELNFGVRKHFAEDQRFRPFVGGGIGLMTVEIDTESQYGYGGDESDTALGVWLDGGFSFSVTETFNIGLRLGYSSADVDINGYEADAGGTHLGFFLGWTLL